MVHKVFRALRSSLSTVAVLGVMVALAIWGHHSHWKVPKFSDLFGSGHEPASVEPQNTARVVATGLDYPIVTFENVVAVRQNGVEFAEASARPLEDYVTASAVVGYNQLRIAQLSSRVAGYIWSVRTQPGQAVKKDEVLALIDSEEVGRAKAEFLKETVTAWYQASRLKRLEAIQDSVPLRSITEAAAALKEAELRRFNTRQRLLNLGFPLDIQQDANQSPEELASQVQFLGLPPEVLAELNPRPATANLIPLKAPFDGVVIQQEVVVGELVRTDLPQLVMADVRTMWIKLSVRKEDADRLDYGQRVEFLAEGMTRPVVGKLSWVSTEIDEKTRTVQARCEVENPVRKPSGSQPGEGLRLLRANLFGTARIRVARHEKAVVVPDTAVQRMPDLTPVVFVCRKDGVSFEPRKVRLGLSRDGFTHILEGVNPGERVVTRGSFVLKSELMKDALTAG